MLSCNLACAGRRPEQVAGAIRSDCAPANTPLDAATDLRDLGGAYRLTFVSTAGPRAGHRADGRLTLRAEDLDAASTLPSDGANSFTRFAVGEMDLALDSIGAVRMGDPASATPEAPGVGVYASRNREGRLNGVLARVGSASNARGPAALDGGHFTLFFRRIASGGAWGGWASSDGIGIGTTRSEGYFCAER